MRHRKKLNHLGRTSSHRKAMLANMASSLILHKRISTTVAKAKALRIYVEPLITKSKNDSTHSRRMVFSYLKNKYAVSELFREVSPKVADRPGGYTRILRTGARLGDNAEMCIIELVDYNENMLAAQADTKTASKRSRRGRGKKAATGAETPADAKSPEKETNEIEETSGKPETAAEKPEEDITRAEEKEEDVDVDDAGTEAGEEGSEEDAEKPEPEAEKPEEVKGDAEVKTAEEEETVAETAADKEEETVAETAADKKEEEVKKEDASDEPADQKKDKEEK